MSPDDLVYLCKGIVKAVEIEEEQKQELQYWREKFISEQKNLPKDAEGGAFIWSTFLFSPSTVLMKVNPEHYFKELVDGYTKRQASAVHNGSES